MLRRFLRSVWAIPSLVLIDAPFSWQCCRTFSGSVLPSWAFVTRSLISSSVIVHARLPSAFTHLLCEDIPSPVLLWQRLAVIVVLLICLLGLRSILMNEAAMGGA